MLTTGLNVPSVIITIIVIVTGNSSSGGLKSHSIGNSHNRKRR